MQAVSQYYSMNLSFFLLFVLHLGGGITGGS